MYCNAYNVFGFYIGMRQDWLCLKLLSLVEKNKIHLSVRERRRHNCHASSFRGCVDVFTKEDVILMNALLRVILQIDCSLPMEEFLLSDCLGSQGVPVTIVLAGMHQKEER